MLLELLAERVGRERLHQVIGNARLDRFEHARLLGLGRDRERPAVWRIGERTYGSARDVEEDGKVVGIRVEVGE